MKRYFSISKGILLGCLLGTLALFSACNDDDNNNMQPDVAGFMAFNLVPDQTAIGVSLSGNQLRSPLPYMSYTGGYVAIYPGERSTDAFSYDNGNTLATATQTYEPQKYYSLFVIGSKDNYQNVIVNDGLDTLNAAKGKAYVRYINAVTGSASADVEISNDTSILFSGQAAYGQVSPFMALDAGAVTIAINDGNKADTSRTITLEDQKAYTLLFAGNPGGNQSSDSVQIRYVENGTLTLDSTSEDLSKKSR